MRPEAPEELSESVLTIPRMNPFEIAGAVIGFVGVALMIRQHVLAWPVGLVQVVIYAWVFYQSKLYTGALLQGIFFVILLYGWWSWSRGAQTGAGRVELAVTRLGRVARGLVLLAGLVITLGWGAFMRGATDAVQPYGDAFILAFSLIAQALQARKKIENWLLWVVVNAAAVVVYGSQDLRLTAALYAVFLLMAVAGWRAWRKTEVRVSP